MEQTKKAAFIKAGSFSHINDSVLNELKKNFPDYRFDVIDMMPRKFSIDIALALLFSFFEYGRDIIFGKKTFILTYNRTKFFFNRRRKYLLKMLSGRNYEFTFQTQSLYDASIPGIPNFLYTDHTHLANLSYPGYDHRLLLNKNWLNLETGIYNNATMIFTMSSNILRSVTDDYGIDPGKVKCVYSGSNVKVSADEKFDESRYSGKNILFVGVDWNRKGGPAMAEAFRKVLQEYPDATLTIVGCRPDIVLPNCNILGRISLADVKQCYNKAAVFCLPTTLEPFGISFLEAMAHKLPVVATNIGAIPDFIHEGKNGHLVKPGDTDGIAAGIIDLFRSEEKCKAYGEYGSRLFHERYTWDKTGKRLHNYIHRFLQPAEEKTEIVHQDEMV